MGLLERLQAERADGAVTPPNDDQLAEECPNLWELITVDKWKDGSKRVLPRIILDRVSGGYLVTIQDDSLLQKKTCFCATLQGVGKALEQCVSDLEIPWLPIDRSFRNKTGVHVDENGHAKKAGRKRS